MRARLRGEENESYRNRRKDERRDGREQTERGKVEWLSKGRRGREGEKKWRRKKKEPETQKEPDWEKNIPSTTPRSTSIIEQGNKLIEAESRKAKLTKEVCL